MDLLNSEPGSSDDTRVTSTLDGKELIGIVAVRVSDISGLADQETTIPAIKTESNEQTASTYNRRMDVSSETSVITREPMSLNDLPNEILLHILSHFGPEDLCLIIAKVCERWNDLAKDKVLWKNLSYSCQGSTDISHIRKVLINAPALHSLIIRWRKDVADILDFLFRNRGYLRKLILEYCSLGENSTGLLANIVALYPDLESLSLEGCHRLTSDSYCLIPSLKKLSKLTLSYTEELSGQTGRFIADSCQNLKTLSLHCGILFDDDELIHIIDSLGKQLTTLIFFGFYLSEHAYPYLSNCARLQKLKVSLCHNMRDRGLLEGIGSLHELTSLRLGGGHKLTAQALSTFLHRPSMTSIVSLELWDCSNLDDEGLKGIAERCIHLKDLAVSSCHCVTDAGISMVIRQCNELHKLSFGGLPQITGKGWLELVPSHLPHLRLLGLNDSRNVCHEYIKKLVAALPELRII